MPALMTMTLLGFAGYSALLPVAPLWVVHGGAGTAGAGLVNGVLLLFTVLAQPLVPGALRRFGWGPVLVAGMLLLGLPPLAQIISDELWVTLALSAVRGLGFGILTVTGTAAVAELVDPLRRGEAIGAYGLAIAVPQLVLLPGAPWLAVHVGFWPVFTISAVSLLGVRAALAVARAVEQAQKLHPHPDKPVGARASGGPITRLLRPTLLLLGVTLAGGAVLSFLPQMSPSTTLTSVGLFLLTLFAALSRWQAGSLSDRYGAQPFLWPLVLLSTVSVSALAWSVREAGPAQAVVLLVGMTVLGVCYGGLQNLTLVVSFDSVARADYGRASAVWNTGFDLGTGLGSVLIGLVAAGTSFTVALLAAAAFSLATLPLAVYQPRTAHLRETPSAR